MPGRIYTERFLTAYQAATVTAYVVPAGKRAVIRDIIAVQSGNNQNTYYVTCAGFFVAKRTLPATIGNDWIETRAVAYAGEQITARLDIAGGSVIVSGYLFDDPVGRSGPPAEQVAPQPGPADDVVEL